MVNTNLQPFPVGLGRFLKSITHVEPGANLGVITRGDTEHYGLFLSFDIVRKSLI